MSTFTSPEGPSDLHLSELELRILFEQAQALAAIVEHSHDAIYRIALDGTVETWNGGAERLYGYSAAEMIGRPITTIFLREHSREPVDLLARIANGETIQEYRGTRVCKEGKPLQVSVCWSPIRNAEGRVVAASAIARDATEREQAERLSTALNEINEVIHSTLDPEQVMQRVITHAATAMESETAAISLREPDGWTVRYIFGFPAEVLGVRMNDDEERHGLLAIRTGQIIAIDDAFNDERANTAHMKKWNVRSVLLVPLRAGREVIGVMYFNYHSRPFHFQPAHLDFAAKLASSVALALENARLYDEAQAAVRLRDHFFNVAAHELRNPLTTMMGYSELLAKPGGLDNAERAQRGVQTIHQQTVRLAKMIDALLDVSRIVQGKFSLERTPVDLSPLITRVVDEFRMTTHKHTLPVALPDAPLIVNGDEMRLEQVLRNLVGNAIKYSLTGGPVLVAVQRCDDQACLSVADSGIGIPADSLPHLFQRFYRAPNAEAHHIPGLGIGLFVTHEVISQHGGAIEVESQEGKGTTFTVHLPLQ